MRATGISNSGWTTLVALITAAPLLVGCDEVDDITLLFQRQSPDPTLHVFPSDEYRGAAVLDAFSEVQLATLPFLRHLRATFQPAWAPTTGIRIPFTQVGDDVDRWVDLDTAKDAIRLYSIDSSPVAAVPLGEVRLQQRTNTLLVRPRAPFAAGRYAVVVLANRLATVGGGNVTRSSDQALIARDGDPLTNPAFEAVAAADPDVEDRSDTLAFWTFTVADPTAQLALLKQIVTGKVAVDKDNTDETLDITAIGPPESRELAVGGAQVIADSDAAVTAVYAAAELSALPTDKIGKIVFGAISVPVFVSDPTPDLAALFFNGTFSGRNPLLPFGPGNPLSLSASTPTKLLPYVMFIPKVHAPKLPVIIGIHGISRSKEDWFTFANAACAAGHALIAIDLYQHGARQDEIAVPEGGFSTHVDPVLRAAGVNFPDPFLNPTFIGRTRDKLRQSIVDQLALIHLLSEGDGDNPLIDFDGDGAPDDFGPKRLIGHSLGGILAVSIAAISPEIDRVVLAAPASHLTQIINDSPRLGRDIDLLMVATANATGFGILADSERRLVPDGAEREVFSRVTETILASVDPASYAAALVSGELGNAPRVLVQFSLGDDVVTNLGNVRLAQALASTDDPDAVALIGDELFPLGIPTTTTGAVVTLRQYAGSHGLLLDFVDPAVTATAQQHAAAFFAAP